LHSIYTRYIFYFLKSEVEYAAYDKSQKSEVGGG